MSGFVIATYSFKNAETIFMVNRHVCQKSFWSSVLDDAFVYASRAAADKKAAQLQFNRPRVLPLEEARLIASKQVPRDEDDDDDEQGWDAHKNY